jgi:hypothetical protein
VRPVEPAPEPTIDVVAVDLARRPRGAFDRLADLSLAFRALPARTRISTAAIAIAIGIAGVIARMVH